MSMSDWAGKVQKSPYSRVVPTPPQTQQRAYQMAQVRMAGKSKPRQSDSFMETGHPVDADVRLGRGTRRNIMNEARYAEVPPELRTRQGFQNAMRLRNWTKGEYVISSNLVTLWTQSVNDRRRYLMLSEELRRFYLVYGILEMIADDAVNPDEDGKIIEVTTEKQALKKPIEEFCRRANLDNVITETIFDLVDYGEYSLRMEVHNCKTWQEQTGKTCDQDDPKHQAGVTGIFDDVNQLGILALYEQGAPVGYLVLREHDYYIEPAHEYAHFVLGNNKLKLKLDEAMDPTFQIDRTRIDKEVLDRLPDYIRIGRPFFYATSQKLRELMLLEMLIPATKLAQLAQSRLVGMRFPAGMPPDQVTEAIQIMEETLNTQTGIDVNNASLGLAEVMSTAGRNKVIPIYQGDDKGALEALEIRQDSNVDDTLKSIVDIRQAILSSLGLPYSLVFGNAAGVTDSEGNKVTELRQYGRYARKLMRVQRAVKMGIKHIIVTHLVNLGLECTYDDIDVSFLQEMVDLGRLEKAEYDDAKQEFCGRQIAFIKELVELAALLGRPLNPAKVQEWLDVSLLSLTNGISLFMDPDPKQDLDDPSTADNEPTQRFLSLAIDQFVQNRQDGGQTDIEDPLDPDDQEPVTLKGKLAQGIADRFQQNIQARDGDTNKKALLQSARDKFLANQKRRASEATNLPAGDYPSNRRYGSIREREERRRGKQKDWLQE
jgi:hypothetical protein